MEMLSIVLTIIAMGIIDNYYFEYKYSLGNFYDTAYKNQICVHEETALGVLYGFLFSTYK